MASRVCQRMEAGLSLSTSERCELTAGDFREKEETERERESIPQSYDLKVSPLGVEYETGTGEELCYMGVTYLTTLSLPIQQL